MLAMMANIGTSILFNMEFKGFLWFARNEEKGEPMCYTDIRITTSKTSIVWHDVSRRDVGCVWYLNRLWDFL